jgi:hypothetical protein
MMRDPSIKAEDIVYKIVSYTGSRTGFEKESEELSKVLTDYSLDKQILLDKLNSKVVSGEIA